MHAILAALIAAASSTVAAVPAPAVTSPATAAVPAPASPLPGAPREAKLTATSDGIVLTWQPPARTGGTALTGYVVIVGDAATYVGADVTRLVVSRPSGVSVAAVNGVGSSVASKASATVARRGARGDRPVNVASR